MVEYLLRLLSTLCNALLYRLLSIELKWMYTLGQLALQRKPLAREELILRRRLRIARRVRLGVHWLTQVMLRKANDLAAKKWLKLKQQNLERLLKS